jgi:hypothetical protein
MHLQTEIAALHGIQKVKPNRELVAEATVNGFAQQFMRMSKHEINRRNLETGVAKTQQQARSL